VVDADIESFFDSIDHDKLLDRLGRLPLDPYVLSLFERWIRAEVYDGARLVSLPRGLPQGSVVSPTLANLVLDELDENLALFGQTLVRYADDFLVLCKHPEDTAAALELTDSLLADLHLKLNPEKTRATSFDEGTSSSAPSSSRNRSTSPATVPTPREPRPTSRRRWIC
jgi:retron-type reverse transcriptase